MILKKTNKHTHTQKQCGRITVQANKLGTFPNAQCTKYHNVICTTQKEHKYTDKHTQLEGSWYLHENK